MKECAFLTMDNLDDFVHYDYLLKDPLASLGWNVSDISWRTREVDWSRFDVVIIRSPWDYQQDPDRFMNVLKEIDHSTARLENALELVQWNIDKTYLRDLEQRGVNIVPTRWGRKSDKLDQQKLLSWFDYFDAEEIVLKPTISAGADDTYRLTITKAKQRVDELAEVFADRAFMVQPMMQNIVDEGEFSLIYFGEEYSHTLLKTPKPHDFRVQEEHGGRLKTVEPEKELRRVSDQLMAKIEPTPLYSRVDMVREGDSFSLMELELIEPSLYFNMDPGSPERFANFLDRWMRIGS
ncbi:RimK family alpha-L-glutamate ligase [Halalkalibaculum sp. DA3122]